MYLFVYSLVYTHKKLAPDAPRTPEGGLPPILATSSRNGSKKLDRLRCEGLPLAPKKQKKSPKNRRILTDSFLSSFLSSFSPLFFVFVTFRESASYKVTKIANYKFFVANYKFFVAKL